MRISALVSHREKKKKHQEKERDVNSSSIIFFKNTTGTVNQHGDSESS